MRTKGLLFLMLVAAFAVAVSAQVTIPRESNMQETSQMIGDTKISISYHRPNVKGRKIWGELVPYNEVWRTGANNATVFETPIDVMINGQKLAKGKYALFTLPTTGNWTIIFNKNWNQWGAFTHEPKDDVLKVEVTPRQSEFHETMAIEFEKVVGSTAEVNIRWENIAVPFTVDVGDFNARFVNDNRRRTMSERITLANYVLSQKMTGSYADALSWVEEAERMNKSFGVLSLKARLLGDMGRKADAIAAGEAALAAGRSANPPASQNALTNLENQIKQWKGTN